MNTYAQDVIEAATYAEVNLIDHRNHCRELAGLAPLTTEEIVEILLEYRGEQKESRESLDKSLYGAVVFVVSFVVFTAIMMILLKYKVL